MITFLFTLVIFVVSIAGLAVGVLLKRQPLRGACGSLVCLPGASCGACRRAEEVDSRL
jgi:hypothetical protein